MHESGHKQIPSPRQPAEGRKGSDDSAAGPAARGSKAQPGDGTQQNRPPGQAPGSEARGVFPH